MTRDEVLSSCWSCELYDCKSCWKTEIAEMIFSQYREVEQE